MDLTRMWSRSLKVACSFLLEAGAGDSCFCCCFTSTTLHNLNATACDLNRFLSCCVCVTLGVVTRLSIKGSKSNSQCSMVTSKGSAGPGLRRSS
jgi:hypothetical protein